MFTAGATIHVQRPVVEVFRFVADARNRPQWDDSVESEELTSAGPIGVGTTVRTTLRTMGRKYRYDWVITEFQAPWRITITSTSGPLPTTLSYRLTDRVTDTEVGFTVGVPRRSNAPAAAIDCPLNAGQSRSRIRAAPGITQRRSAARNLRGRAQNTSCSLECRTRHADGSDGIACKHRHRAFNITQLLRRPFPSDTESARSPVGWVGPRSVAQEVRLVGHEVVQLAN